MKSPALSRASAPIVVQIGEGVNNLKIGDRVGIPWLHSACGECEYCTSGWESLCLSQQNTGYIRSISKLYIYLMFFFTYVAIQCRDVMASSLSVLLLIWSRFPIIFPSLKQRVRQ